MQKRRQGAFLGYQVWENFLYSCHSSFCIYSFCIWRNTIRAGTSAVTGHDSCVTRTVFSDTISNTKWYLQKAWLIMIMSTLHYRKNIDLYSIYRPLWSRHSWQGQYWKAEQCQHTTQYTFIINSNINFQYCVCLFYLDKGAIMFPDNWSPSL